MTEKRPGGNEHKTKNYIPEEEIESRRLVSSWESITKDNEGQAHIHTLRKYEYETALSEDQKWQAQPANITYSTAQPEERNHKVIFAYGDIQAGFREVIDHRTQQREYIPLHDERALLVARYICRDVMPDTIVNLSDSVDLASLSRFKKDSNHFNNELSMAFQYIHNHYAELRADNPNARIVEVASNHNQRLTDYVLANFPQAYNLHRPGSDDIYPVLSYPYLTNLQHLDVEWIGGYPAGELVYGEEYDAPPIVFRHGTETSSNGTTASKIMKNNPETHNVHGHSHSTSETWHTTRAGRYLGSFAVGAMCRLDGVVPSYYSAVDDFNQPVKRQEKWDQSVMVIRDYENGDYEFDTVMINNGRAYYKGKAYDADQLSGHNPELVTQTA